MTVRDTFEKSGHSVPLGSEIYLLKGHWYWLFNGQMSTWVEAKGGWCAPFLNSKWTGFDGLQSVADAPAKTYAPALPRCVHAALSTPPADLEEEA